MTKYSSRAAWLGTIPLFLFTLQILASGISAQVTLQGNVWSMTGVPIAGATVRLVTLNRTTTTDANGHYDFATSLSLDPISGAGEFSLSSNGSSLVLNLFRARKVVAELFGFDGRHMALLADEVLQPGSHTLALPSAGNSQRLLLVRFRIGSDLLWKKLAMRGGRIAMSDAKAGEAGLGALAKSAEAPDSVNVTHPNYHGGLYNRHGRRVTATTGVQHFRMFPTDPGWSVCAPPVNFIFTPSVTGVSYYQQTIPNYVATEQEVLRETCQSIWRLPSEVPSNRRYTSYTANVNGNVTTGAAGFGESMPDAIRALTGFFTWRTAGNRCSGSYTDTYQTGARYWYYIEMKYPGFIYNIYKLTSGDISARVQQVTGQSLSSLVTECQTTGMPPGSG